MGSSLDSYLRDLSYSFYLKKSSTEISKIETSKANLLSNLDNELGTKIKRRFVFGSCLRSCLEKFDPTQYEFDLCFQSFSCRYQLLKIARNHRIPLQCRAVAGKSK